MIEAFEMLKQLIEDDTSTENECRNALRPLAQHLLADSSLTLTKAEWASDRGRIDLILIAEPINLRFESQILSTTKVAKIYELKSPHKFMFEFDKNSKRFLPSSDLVQAETQLLDYTYRSLDDRYNFQIRFGASQIEFGGIIIGREKTMFNISEAQKKRFEQDDLEHLKQRTLLARTALLYKNNGIKLFSWDHVLSIIQAKL